MIDTITALLFLLAYSTTHQSTKPFIYPHQYTRLSTPIGPSIHTNHWPVCLHQMFNDVGGPDFAIAEEYHFYEECGMYTGRYRNRVIET